MWLSGAAVLLAVAGGMVFLLRGGPAALETGDKIGSIGSFVFGVASLFVTVVALRSARKPTDDDPAVLLGRAVEELARLVAAQWRREAQWRGLLHPGPMRITWSSTTRPVSAPVGEIISPMPGVRPTRLRLHGFIGEVAATWQRLPARQLVVIGSPAAGKTSLAVLFVREVLADRAPGDPVPVLLNVAGWDPVTTHLDTWVARRLEADYPQLTARRSFGTDAAVRLVDRRRVIPVLDGLDEMPETLRPLAVTALNQAVADDRALVVTCRTDEFETMIAASGAPLGRAAVVELAPLSDHRIAEYLPAGQIDGTARWSPVLAQLTAEPDGVLAQTLSNPLMAYMARTAYATPDTDPAELLAFHTVTETEEHLFETYLPMAYRPRLPSPDEEPLRPYRVEDARQWLTVIANQLHQKGTRNLCLWRLQDIRPGFRQSARMLSRSWRKSLQVAGGLTLLAALLVATVQLSEWLVGLVVLMSLVLVQRPHVLPTRVRLRPVRVGIGIVMVIGLGTLLGNIGLPKELDFWTAFAGILMLGLGMAAIGRVVIAGLIDASPSKVVLSPAVALRQDRTAFLVVVVASAGMMLGVVSFVALPDIGSALRIAVMGLAVGLLACGILGVGRAWASWSAGRAWLALLGLLPWRLLPFIEDAHRRGVLRAVGTEYQFRHVRLQDYLARSGSGTHGGVGRAGNVAVT